MICFVAAGSRAHHYAHRYDQDALISKHLTSDLSHSVGYWSAMSSEANTRSINQQETSSSSNGHLAISPYSQSPVGDMIISSERSATSLQLSPTSPQRCAFDGNPLEISDDGDAGILASKNVDEDCSSMLTMNKRRRSQSIEAGFASNTDGGVINNRGMYRLPLLK